VTAPDPSLERIADKLAIQELCARYNWYVDQFLIDPLMALFVDDQPVFDETPAGLARSEGQDGIRAYYGEGLFKQLKHMVHFTTNFFLDELSGDHARGRCSAHVFAETQDGGKVEVLCWYDDIYRRSETGWQFVSRTVTPYTTPQLDAITSAH
jgi:ketosteroid isomerase-like protein